MLPELPGFRCIDGRLEIHFPNGTFIKFLHGRDAEVTVEGEAIDRFVIDEAGKIIRQVWHSLFTTITQTMGYGIITGTPRGFTWYYETFRKAKKGDPFFCWAQISTEDSPYVLPEAIANAKRLLPKFLYDQYYRAAFLSQGSTFGDLSTMFDEGLSIPDGMVKFWLHPDEQSRNQSVIHGMDLAKQRDYTVIYSVNEIGQLTGYCRFRHVPYPAQARRLEIYLKRFYSMENSDNILRFDATGVGSAVADLFAELEIDCAITPVVFTNKAKSEMVTRTIMAIQEGWHTAPRIEQIDHEFASYELTVTKSGLHSYNAPSGEHDDVVCAAMLAISAAYQSSMASDAEKMLEDIMTGNTPEQDEIANWADAMAPDGDTFFDEEEADEDDEDDFDQYLEE